MTADADAFVSDGDYNIGGGIGLNIVQNDNEAVIGSGAAITSGDLTVEAGMRAELQDDNSMMIKTLFLRTLLQEQEQGHFH